MGKKLNKVTYLFVAIISLHVILILNVNFFPYPELFIYPYLAAHKLVPYLQIFDQHFPGLMFSPINFYTLGFRSPDSFRLLQVLLIVINQFFIYKISQKQIKNPLIAFVPNLLYLLWQPFLEGYVLWIDSFIPPFLLSAYMLMTDQNHKNYKRLFLAGIILGICLIFKQVLAPLIIVLSGYALIKYKTKSNKLYFLFGVAIPCISLLVYIFYLGIFQEFYYWTVTFNLTTFAQMGRKFATLNEVIKSSLIFGAALISAMVLIARYKKYLLLTIFFVFSLIFAYARFDFVHLQPALPFAVILVGILFSKLNHKFRLSILCVYLLICGVILVRFYKTNWGREVYFLTSNDYQIINQVKDLTSPGDKIFVLGYSPSVYAFTDTLPPGNKFSFQFPWFMLKAQDIIYDGVVSDPPKLILRQPDASTDKYNLISFMPKLDQFVMKFYTKISEINGVEFWEKR